MTGDSQTPRLGKMEAHFKEESDVIDTLYPHHPESPAAKDRHGNKRVDSDSLNKYVFSLLTRETTCYLPYVNILRLPKFMFCGM